MIYFDNAATTLVKPPRVAEAVVQAMQSMGNCGRGSHPCSRFAAGAVYEARIKLAAFFGCKGADHVVFTQNATQALNMALYGLLSTGDHVISTVAEHNSVLRPLYRLQREVGLELDLIPADEKGTLRLELLPKLLKPNTKAVVCTHISNLTGNITDLETIRRFAAAHQLLLVVDAAQSAGYLPIHMEQMGIDILCVTGHKGLMGPQGTGALLLREELDLRPLCTGGTGVQSYLREQPAQLPEHLEAGTLNAHGIAGLSAAIDYLNDLSLERIRQQEDALTARFYEAVQKIPGVRVYGDFSRPHAPIVSLNLGSWDSGAVSDALAEDYGIATRPGAHCAPLMHMALGTEVQGAVRFSFCYHNTEEEIDTAICAIAKLAAE